MNPEWLKLKNQILGKDYDLSVAFVDKEEMFRLNHVYRKKKYSADVLSFPLTEKVGEILLNKLFQKNKRRSGYLFLHSLLHLSGMKHGQKMDKTELEILKHPNKI